MDFLDSSFFKNKHPTPALPSPSEVRAKSKHSQHPYPEPLIFEPLNLIVQFGPHVSIIGAQSQWWVRAVLGEEIPLPELFGWGLDEGVVFIYMKLILGETLFDRWEDLTEEEKIVLCGQFRKIMAS
jgi:hypothetical protein